MGDVHGENEWHSQQGAQAYTMSGGIDFSELETREYDFSSAANAPDQQALLADLERRAAARRIAVPTNDRDVRLRLRELGHPVTLFSERPEDRRDRLRSILAKQHRERAAAGLVDSDEEEESDSSDDEEEEFYTEGSQALKQARREIADFSLPRAKKRVARQRAEADLPLGRLIDVRKAVFGYMQKFTNLGSQVGDSRALASLRFSPDSSMLLTSSWLGDVKLWDVPNCREIKTFKAHKERVGGVAWHPQATVGLSRDAANFVTSGADNDVKLWSLNSTEPLRILSGHTARVCRVAYHPSGKYVGSASFDGSWRLWDVKRGEEELLLQEGHSKEVYAIEFQEDGSLACSGGLDAIGRVWDLRSGRTVMVLDGHVRDILSIDFSPNGYQVATGSNDDSVKIWDLRQLKCLSTIPAHRSAVSDVRFFRTSYSSASAPTVEVPRGLKSLPFFSKDGEEDPDGTPMDVDGASSANADLPLSGLFLVTGGYDGYVKVWSADDWQLQRQMTSDSNGRVMGVDVSCDARFIASSEYNRTFKLWSSPDVDLS